jgi:hypothetical protein
MIFDDAKWQKEKMDGVPNNDPYRCDDSRMRLGFYAWNSPSFHCMRDLALHRADTTSFNCSIMA